MDLHHNTVKFNYGFLVLNYEEQAESIFKIIKQNLTSDGNYYEKYGSAKLKIIIVLDAKNKGFRVLGPTVGKKLIDYTIWVDIKKIKNAKYAEFEFSNQLVFGIKEIFKKFELEDEVLNEKLNDYLLNLGKLE